MLVFLVKFIYAYSADNLITLGSSGLKSLQKKFCHIVEQHSSYQNLPLFLIPGNQNLADLIVHSVLFILNHFWYNMDTEKCSYVTGMNLQLKNQSPPWSPGYKPQNTSCVTTVHSEEIFLRRATHFCNNTNKTHKRGKTYAFFA
jgi:hypothetical protein